MSSCVPPRLRGGLLAFLPLFLASACVEPAPDAGGPAQSSLAAHPPEADFDLFASQREMVRRGQQALILCNGIFVSERTVERVFRQELRIIGEPIGTADGGAWEIDQEVRGVAVGDPASGPVMRAAYREGLGCVGMGAEQDFSDVGELPILELDPPAGNAAEIAWPDGDLTGEITVPAGIDRAALQAASDWAFERDSEFQETISLLIVHRGSIIHERYAPGFDMTTRTRTWSTAKSLGATLIGMLVDEGRMALDEPLALDWIPELRSPETDPRREITLRHVLNMTSGLNPHDNRGLADATGSGLGYWAGFSSAELALDRGVVREPGTYWDYENSDTLLGIMKMRQVLGDDAAYLAFPRRALLDRIGMRSTLPGTDRFGDYILSSQVYTNARDLARLGLLHLNGGMWNGERLLSEEWIEFVQTPAPATAERGNEYGGQWWLVPDDRKGEVPADAYTTAGNRGQFTLVVPSHDLVIVRRGLDWGRQGFDRWGLVREVLRAFGEG